MTESSNLEQLDGYPFEVRYSPGALERAHVSADIIAEVYTYFSGLFRGVAPDIALIVADEADWGELTSRCPYGLPFFNDEVGQIRPGIVVMPAGIGDFWVAMAQDLVDTSPEDYANVLASYPDGAGGVNLQPFFDLITIHELGHAFEVLGDLRLPTFWLSELFANLSLHAFVATQRPLKLPTLEVLSTVGARSRNLARRMRATGFSSLEELQEHYTGGDDSMDPLNYVWYQYRWQRIVAEVFEIDGEDGLVRFWDCFQGRDRPSSVEDTVKSLSLLLTSEVSSTLGRAVRDWR
jgi:hypothetical protein